MSSDSIKMTIEQIIRDDKSGEAKACFLEYYNTQQVEIGRKLAQGVSPSEYEQLQVVHDALQASATVLRTI